MSTVNIEQLKDLWENELCDSITVTDSQYFEDLELFKKALKDLFKDKPEYSDNIQEAIVFIRKFYKRIKEYIDFNTDSNSRLNELKDIFEDFSGKLRDLAIEHGVISPNEDF